MANFLAQFQTIKSTSERLIVAIEDVSDLWPTVKDGFEARVPFRKACLNNKARNPVYVEKLPVEFILTTDSRLRSRFPQEQSPFWFRQPYSTVVLVTCEDFDEYKTILKPRLKLIVQNDDREWFIVFVSKAYLSNDQAGKLTRRIYNKLEVDFSSKKRERCCKLDMHVADAAFWEDVEAKMVECIRNTLDKRVQFYEEEIRKLSENRFMPVWNFCNFFILKESLAFMFEMSHLHDDALREYDELELCYLETVNAPNIKQKEFGGLDHGDDRAALLEAGRKSLSQIVQDDTLKEFDFRQYLFARQSQLLFKLNRPVEVAARGYMFIISFSKTLSLHERNLPFCLREVWVITGCLALIKGTVAQFDSRLVIPDAEKEFNRLQGDLYSLGRVKLMRLADLTGYGVYIERSSCNSAALSMLPWPKPAVWPSIPPDAAALVLEKEKVLEQNPKPFGIMRNPLPLGPTMLLREANRRRASLSAGNVLELFESRHIVKDSPATDGHFLTSPPQTVSSSRMSRTNSGPAIANMSSPSRALFDRPMKLSEILVAAEFALHKTITDEGLRKTLSSIEGFEKMYLELTKGAADNYHQSWWKRHGVVLDGEVAALCYRHGNFDSAAKLYEKVCALYAGEGWQALLAEVLPNLADCQKQLEDHAGYLTSCVRLLSLEQGLLHNQERQALQVEVVRLAHSEMKNPVSLDVSSLITFSGKSGPPLDLCEGDPGDLSVAVWSGFPDEISLDSLSLTLIATFSADEGVKVVKSSKRPLLKPGINDIMMLLPPQRAGSYVLGVLTGQIGQLRFRSHTFSKGGPPDSDDFMSFEKPLRPVLKVSKPRALVDISAAVSSGLLMSETQWLGLVIRPIDYSLKGAILHIDTGPGLQVEASHTIELETCTKAFNSLSEKTNSITTDVAASIDASCFSKCNGGDIGTIATQDIEQLQIKDGRLALPDWASNITTVLWLPVRAIDDRLDRTVSAGIQALSSPSPLSGSSFPSVMISAPRGISLANEGNLSVQGQSEFSQKRNIVDGMRTVALKLEYGASHSRIFERTIAVHFTDPLRISTRVVTKSNDGTLLLQVTLFSQVKAALTILDAWLDLQSGFVHVGSINGRPNPSNVLPLAVSPSSRGGLLFTVRLGSNTPEEGESPVLSTGKDESILSKMHSILNIHYDISGNRAVGAHTPMQVISEGSNGGVHKDSNLFYRSALVLQMPVLEPSLAVGVLPLSSDCLRVGQLVNMRWRVERLKGCVEDLSAKKEQEELLYEVEANSENWMIAGRKRGHVLLPAFVGARIVISIACVPLTAGYVRPPCLGLANVDRANISSNPAGPHLICILPPTLCSSFCAAK
eukprot:Gb_23994 [translate_table: standard]